MKLSRGSTMRFSRLNLPKWPWPLRQPPIEEIVGEPVPEEEPEPEPVPEEEPEPEPEPEPAPEPIKGLTHELMWAPIDWASLEVNRGDGQWVHLASNSQEAVTRLYARMVAALAQTLDQTKTDLDKQEEGTPEQGRLQSVLTHFSKIEYRVRDWEADDIIWIQHSVGMKPSLERIMQRLRKDGIPADRVLVSEIDA